MITVSRHCPRMNEDLRVDVVLYPSGEVKAVPAGKGAAIVRSYSERNDGTATGRRVLAWLLVTLVVAYSLLVVRNLLAGILAATVVYAAMRLLPAFTGTDADLLDGDVTVRDAREQWDATPVSEVTAPGESDRRREVDHAFEGD